MNRAAKKKKVEKVTPPASLNIILTQAEATLMNQHLIAEGATARFVAGLNSLELTPFSAMPCAQCGFKGASKFCKNCSTVFYCDKQCQTQHWSQHKIDCQKRFTIDPITQVNLKKK